MKLYKALTFLATPLIGLYLIKRKMAGKEDPKRMQERLGRTNFPRPEGHIIWIHAASVGESLSVLPLIERLTTQFPAVKILLTTGTTTSARLMEARLPANAFHQYVPVDSILAVKRFLKYWRPSLVLWVESELWPNLLNETAKLCPLILINARISNRSFAAWQKYTAISEALLKNFTLFLPQSHQDALRLRSLGAYNIKLIGNLKYDAPPLPADSQKTDDLRTMIGSRHVWVASSTHPGEEEIIAEAHRIVKAKYPDLLTIIIPRHPQRGQDIAAQTEAWQLRTALRSASASITPETDIYIADTMGELGIFFRLSNIVFIGGSLVKHGGQNPLEAARLDCAILAGPYTSNFLDIYQELEEHQAMLKVTDGASLADTLEMLIRNPEKQDIMAKFALSIAKAKGDILQSYITEIQPYIEKIDVASGQKTHVA